jgi:hypothetical protein
MGAGKIQDYLIISCISGTLARQHFATKYTQLKANQYTQLKANQYTQLKANQLQKTFFN